MALLSFSADVQLLLRGATVLAFEVTDAYLFLSEDVYFPVYYVTFLCNVGFGFLVPADTPSIDQTSNALKCSALQHHTTPGNTTQRNATQTNVTCCAVGTVDTIENTQLRLL